MTSTRPTSRTPLPEARTAHERARRVARPLTVAAAGSLLFATAACGGSSDGSETTSDSTPATSAATTDSTTGSTDSSSGSFKAGEYEETGSYQTPGGTESVDVDVTITADGTITDVEVKPNATGGNSEMFQKQFASGISAQVKGKKINELSVSKVSGSSLTSGGFNSAIAEIVKKAQA